MVLSIFNSDLPSNRRKAGEKAKLDGSFATLECPVDVKHHPWSNADPIIQTLEDTVPQEIQRLR